jgi:large conductance mechanosensitive channel
MLKEFKAFAMTGNLVDMAVAFVMGAAFGKLVTGFIDGIFMPVVGKLTAGVDFKTLKYILSEAQLDASGKVIAEETAIKYGEFITISIDFILIAFCMFLLIKGINKMKKKELTVPAPVPGPTEDQKLLSEIRDLLKRN